MDFREESFLNGFSEGMEKIAGPKTEAVRKGVTSVKEFLKGAPSKIKAQWQGTQKGGPKATWGDILRGIVGGRGKTYVKGLETGKGARIPVGEGWKAPGKEVRRGALKLLGKRALIAGAPAAAGVGLGAALKKRKKEEK